ncbi:hypothetical protein HGP17_25510 [Rhizobium sp. P38BS-XIX]|uniref:hypothetical protein n=1 Tax=Rhizobium sp. P38BS-XIX TaxID=2726740 RepID=UPI001456F6FB|nr:hypothetical protein [Rhizobium sp. P38BS-XIX]NLS00197.1 hypothetical protein [Rhizobium sp. P38BS-XIX]
MNKFFVTVERHFPLRGFLFVASAILFVCLAVRFAFAADAAAPADNSTLINVLVSYGVPLVEAVLSVLVTWAITKVIQLLGITDQATRLKVAGQLRDALHFAAENGLKYAFAKLGAPPSLAASASVIADAIAYVKSKNPDTVAALGVDDQALEHIILSKLPSLMSAALAVPTVLNVTAPGVASSRA